MKKERIDVKRDCFSRYPEKSRVKSTNVVTGTNIRAKQQPWTIKDVTVEASTTRGTTALVYCLINSSLYTGTVQRWWSTPNWLDGQ